MASAIPSAPVAHRPPRPALGPRQTGRQAGRRRRAAEGPWGLSLSPVGLLFMVKFMEEAGLGAGAGAGVEVPKKAKRQL